MQIILVVSEIFAPDTSLVSRIEAEELMSAVPPEGVLILDFKDMEFTSRPFVDEILRLVEERGQMIRLRNAVEFIQDMFLSVRQQRKNPPKLEPIDYSGPIRSLTF